VLDSRFTLFVASYPAFAELEFARIGVGITAEIVADSFELNAIAHRDGAESALVGDRQSDVPIEQRIELEPLRELGILVLDLIDKARQLGERDAFWARKRQRSLSRCAARPLRAANRDGGVSAAQRRGCNQCDHHA
jgi:hypothetical protein